MPEFPKLPDHIVIRRKDGEQYFGFKKTHLDQKIADGTVPKPFPLSADGRASGWYGWQINEHNDKIRANAGQWEETRAAKRRAAALDREAKKRARRRRSGDE